MVRMRKYLEIITDENLIENAQIVGGYFLEKLTELQSEFPGEISNVRGRGLMLAFDLSSSSMRDAFLKKIFKNQVIALGCGQQSVRFRPSLTLTKSLVDQATEIVKKSLQETLN